MQHSSSSPSSQTQIIVHYQQQQRSPPQSLSLSSTQSQYIGQQPRMIINTIQTVSTTIIEKQLQLANDQFNRIQSYLIHLQNILTNICRYKTFSYQQQSYLKEEINTLESTISNYQYYQQKDVHYQHSRLIDNKHQRFIEIWNQRIVIARSINVEKLYKLNIEDKLSLANNVFKLILMVFYNQPLTKYYWSNFKRQAFKNDNGQDFIQRLARIDPKTMKAQQLSMLKMFLNEYDTISGAKQLLPAIMQVQKIHKIAIRHFKCHQISIEIQHIKELIEKQRQNIMLRDDQVQRQQFRLQALNSKLQNVKQFMQLITSVQQKIKTKKQVYEKMLMKLQDAKQIMKKDKTLIQLDKFTQTQFKQFCQCKLM